MAFKIPHNMNNVGRMKHVAYAVVLLGMVISGILAVNALIGLREVLDCELAQQARRTELSQLSLQLVQMQRLPSNERLSPGGLEVFAVTLFDWAKARNVNVSSIVPEGVPVSTEVEISGTRIGKWKACLVRVKGEAHYANAMNLIAQLRNIPTPVEVASCSLKSTDAMNGEISFDLVLTVYEKQREAR
ncbi:MAG: hypothetical protein NT018_09765 [Armatimonadetes bacterium]|nr:hypothetical protein [Armatimonadota bacterium]